MNPVEIDDGPKLPTGAPEAGYSPEWFEFLEKIERRHFWFRSRNRLIVHLLKRHFPGASNLLEVGSGGGCVLSALSEAQPTLALTGGEPFAEGLEIARRRVPNATHLELFAEDIPFKNEFDVVGCFDVLEHLKHDTEALSQIFQATRPGGGAIFSVPQHMWLWSQADVHAHHQRRYTRRELVAKVKAAGFEVEFCTSYVSSLLPIMLVSRLTSRKTYRPDRELRIVPFVNGLCNWIMGAEFRLISWGRSLRAGGSLFVVARKPASSASKQVDLDGGGDAIS